ncbi:MAG: hypothetical protein R6X12_01370 [bacterium]
MTLFCRRPAPVLLPVRPDRRPSAISVFGLARRVLDRAIAEGKAPDSLRQDLDRWLAGPGRPGHPAQVDR